MKKIFTYSVAMALFGLSLPAFAQDAASGELATTVTFNRAVEDCEWAFTLCQAGAGNIQVDWGDGELKTYAVKDYTIDYGTEITGTMKGYQLKIYTADPANIQYFDISYAAKYDALTKVLAVDLSKLTGVGTLYVGSNSLTALDLSNMTSLATLSAENNNITSLTLPANAEKLTSINIFNTVNTTTGEITAGSNSVLAMDWSKAPNLNTLNVAGNAFDSFSGFSIAGNKLLKTLNVNGCGLTDEDFWGDKPLDLTNNTALKTLNAQWNELTKIDLSNVAANTYAYLQHNSLSSITIPAETATGSIGRLFLDYNNFTFQNLPVPGTPKMPTSASGYTYANQPNIVASLSKENTIDLSSYVKVGDTDCTFSWSAILDGQTEPVTLTAEGDAPQYEVTAPGVFKFLVPVKDLTADINCTLFPKLTLKTVPTSSVALLPIILSFDVERSEGADGIFLGLNDSEGQNVYIDWGDGDFAGPYEIAKNGYDYSPTKPGVTSEDGGWTEIAAPLKGNTIKVKGNPETIVTLEVNGTYDWTSGKATSALVKTIDISALKNLQKIALNNNALTTIDLSSAPELKSVSLQANKLTSFDFNLPNLYTIDISNQLNSGKVVFGENKIAELDFEKLPGLTKLWANAAGLKPDFSKASKLEAAYLQGNEFTEFAPVSATLTTLSMNFSTELTKFDASGLTSSSVNVFLNNNKLGATKESLKLSPSVNNLNIANGLFTFSTLPAVNSVKGTLTYSPQSAMATEYKDGNVNLADQAKVGDTATEYVWKLNGEAVDDVTATSDGIFTFKYNGEYTCSMTNAEFPKLTLNTVPVTVTGVQDRPVKLFSFTVAPEAVGKTMSLNISSTDYQNVTVDWGNGTLSNPVATKDYDKDWEYGTPTGTIAGTEITVYGTNAATINQLGLGYDKEFSVECKMLTLDVAALIGIEDLNVGSNNLTSLDVSKNVALNKLFVNNNKLTNIEFGDNSAITRLEIQNTADSGENDVFKMNLAKLPKLSYLVASFNNKNMDITEYNFEGNPELATVIVQSCNLSKVDISKNPKISQLTVTDNNLTSLDISTALETARIFAANNRISEITLNKVQRLNVENNCLTFATLPAIDKVTQSAAYLYGNQKPMVVKAEGAVVDLSSQAKVGDTETVYTWTVGAEEFKDVTISNGVSTFTKTAENAVCSMTNAEYPKLTLTTIPVTVEVAGSGVEDIEAAEEGEAIYFNLQGVKVDGTTPGVYIRVLNGKSQKVIVK